MKITKLLYSLVFTLLSLSVFGQQQPKQGQAQSGRVELLGADELIGGTTFNGQKADKLIGNVSFKQKDGFLYADSVYQYRDSELLEAFGKVRIVQADTVTMTGDHALYDGATRTATMTGNVVMKDPRMTLTTPSLDYDLNTKTAYYTEGGTIVDPENRLQSRKGVYETQTKMFTFEQDVKVTTKDYNITAQNMKYNTLTKVVYFQGPTVIKGQQGDLYAEEGTYNSLEKISRFGRNAYILTPEYRLGGDKLYYDEQKGYGYAEVNVSLRSLKDDVTIYGQTGRYWRDSGISKVYGKPMMETIMDNDTLYMAADTLVSRESKAPGMPSMLFAYNNVKIFKSDLQGKCDSLSYNRTDSVMHMNIKPVLWNEQTQMVSDTVRMHMRNKTIEKMYMFGSAFIASEDSLKNYNQVKGRDMTAFFKEGKISRVNVNGNGESLYFALEGDSVLTGANKAICSDMVLRFADNKLHRISFLMNPDATFVPPHELKVEDKQLEDFKWLPELRPEKQDIVSLKSLPKVQPIAPRVVKKQSTAVKPKVEAKAKPSAKNKNSSR
ncbi:OstA-like protein [Pontibacter silvestris]|uniref:OstA-like protein n=1 Tax=Pontibacter silvestris TaxID=2305183 RepID=A0ABW4WVW3_9BACT|nr:OstA-like protein [Pontibacter silvestris]MCC9138075.1 LPS export ABC transporter periplasmic protein LptC [Pontibacter silvestris]